MARRSYRNWKDTDTPPLFRPESNWRPPRFEDLPQSWKGIKRIGLDTETRDDDLRKTGPGVRRGGYIVGVSFAIEDGPKFYLPARHREGDNMDEKRVFQYLRDRAQEFTGSIVGANLGYDLDYLAEEGITYWDKADFRDVQVAEPLLNENRLQYSLEALCKVHGLPGKSEEGLRDAAQAYHIDPKSMMWKLPARYVGLYAEDDALRPLQLLRRQERLIDEQGLWDIYDLERQVQPILVRMRRHGVRINFSHLDKVEAWTIEQEMLMLDEIFSRTGIRICLDEINKKTLTARVLDSAGLPYDSTPTGQPKINTDLLAPLASKNRIASLILHVKYLNKLRNTFVKSIRTHQVNGRIHTTFNQLKRQGQNSDNVVGAGPGRMSSSDPNLQQQPGRKPTWWTLDMAVAKFWRKIYLPDEGGMWAAMDYCFSSDTEVLTEKGFIKFNNLNRTEKLAQYDDGVITYAQPVAYQAIPYTGDMVHIHGKRQVDMLVSPEHRCLLTGADGKNMKWVQAQSPWGTGATIAQSGMLVGDHILPKQTIQEAVILQADGAYRKTHYRVWLKRQDKIDRIMEITGQGPDYVCTKKAAGTCFNLKPNTLVLPGPYKIFNRELLLTLTSSLREIFIQELKHWDGSTKSHVYYTSSRQNAEIVQEIALLTGYRSNIVPRTRPGRKIGYVVSLNKKPGTYIKTLQKDTIPYTGDTIYCVTMPKSTVIVRRNGRVSVCGQCGQEPRLLTHFANICKCPGAPEAAHAANTDPNWDFHDTTTELAFGATAANTEPNQFKFLRGRAKIIFLGLVYGMGGGKLCRSLGFPVELREIHGEMREVAGPEGVRFLEEFHKNVPFLSEIKQLVEAVAWNRRHIITLGGRHIHYEPGFGNERKALNNLIQGSAADQAKIAMVQIYKNGGTLQLQVHDEFDTTVYTKEEAYAMAETMKSCVTLTVPSDVDVELGQSWGHSMEKQFND
ncbi:MAG: hypothetical protein GY934_09690 [Gammaproteobacteria bacterium]|nr:hypothetical protein [Gammaproteobacteria bacterium]